LLLHVQAGDDLLVRIQPKAPVSNLFGMLEVAYSLQSFRFLDGETEIESIEHLYERIVSILSRRVLDRSRKGLYRSYISETDELPYVRGRIDSVATRLQSGRIGTAEAQGELWQSVWRPAQQTQFHASRPQRQHTSHETPCGA